MVRPIVIQGHQITFLISGDPNLCDWDHYLKMLYKYSVNLIIEFSPAIYPPEVTEYYAQHKIKVNYLPVLEGHAPTPNIIKDWFEIIDNQKLGHNSSTSCSLAIHCNSGFGRAPLMVALSLIRDGSDAYSAITMIRKHRPRALNHAQLEFLYQYEDKAQKHSCLIQ